MTIVRSPSFMTLIHLYSCLCCHEALKLWLGNSLKFASNSAMNAVIGVSFCTHEVTLLDCPSWSTVMYCQLCHLMGLSLWVLNSGWKYWMIFPGPQLLQVRSKHAALGNSWNAQCFITCLCLGEALHLLFQSCIIFTVCKLADGIYFEGNIAALLAEACSKRCLRYSSDLYWFKFSEACEANTRSWMLLFV